MSWNDDMPEKCPICDGTGYDELKAEDEDIEDTKCEFCDGTGYI